MADPSEAPALLAKMEREGFPPMDPKEFQDAYGVMIKVAAGVMPRPVLTETMIDPETGQAQSAPGSPADWGMMAAAQMLNADDPLKPANFGYRVNKVLKIAFEKAYQKYRNEKDDAMHVALLAAVAQVPFSVRTTPKALRAAFAAEFKRQRARLGNEMVSFLEIAAAPAPGVAHRYAIEPLPGVVAGSYAPLTLAEFRKAYTLMLQVAGGFVDAPPVTGDEVAQVDSGKPLLLEDTPFNRGWIAGARSLGDDSDSAKPTSFAARIMRVLPIAQGPEYDEHRTDAVTIHIALIAAMASVQFNGKTPEEELRRTFAAEVKRQFGRIDELIAEAMAEPDFHLQAMGSTRH